jgi:hypothetical protein
MDAEVPRCPTCGAPVQSDWDWCHLCGYDPEGLKPIGWSPTAPTEPAPTGRGRKRASKAKDKPKAQPKAKAPRGSRPLPTPPPQPQWQAQGQWQPDLRPPIGMPTAGIGLEQTFHVPADIFEKVASVVAFALAALMTYLTGMAVWQIADGVSTSILDNVATVVFVLVCALIAFALVVQGRAFVRQKVVLTPTELAAYNRFGRVRRVPRADIHGISMGQRQFQLPGVLSQPMEVPYVQLDDGSGFWLDALGSRNPTSSPSDEQLAMYEKVVAAIEADREARAHETSTLNI